MDDVRKMFGAEVIASESHDVQLTIHNHRMHEAGVRVGCNSFSSHKQVLSSLSLSSSIPFRDLFVSLALEGMHHLLSSSRFSLPSLSLSLFHSSRETTRCRSDCTFRRLKSLQDWPWGGTWLDSHTCGGRLPVLFALNQRWKIQAPGTPPFLCHPNLHMNQVFFFTENHVRKVQQFSNSSVPSFRQTACLCQKQVNEWLVIWFPNQMQDEQEMCWWITLLSKWPEMNFLITSRDENIFPSLFGTCDPIASTRFSCCLFEPHISLAQGMRWFLMKNVWLKIRKHLHCLIFLPTWLQTMI